MNSSLYNATVIGKILLTPDLMILRIKTDQPRNEFVAGQYTSIGLLSNEQRSANSVVTIEPMKENELIIRPYSIASAKHEISEFEFYISQVKSGQLTPRLFNLTQGRRMWIDDKIHGIFNLNEVPDGSNIVMIATGTGLAPYMSFLRSHLKDHTESKLAVVHGAGYPWDLGYYSELRFIEQNFKNFYYFPTLLKADSSWTGLTGYIEKHLEAEALQNEAGIEINPNKTHFFLCGNPKMVESVTNYLSKYNYTKHCEEKDGALHVEEY
ncbi:MAG: ferredoxin--NADP reductase [Candidatus Kapabacteria bacterium]|nr:ferredoxin--NADP reductase [Ignavibacteriota bacterium]MCW5885052.1 ferredoxin--NADP reductase [Candidatus Kapabacteria bacterium]